MDNNLLGLAERVKPNSAKPPGELQEAGNTPEIVAAITAAISACLNVSSDQFVINSLKPVPPVFNSSFWTIAGRKRLMEQRQDLAILRRRKN